MKVHVIACKVTEPEWSSIQDAEFSITYLEQGLHNTPAKMPDTISAEVKRLAETDADMIVLGYGLCSNGIVGVKAENQPIIVPRVDDCIALFLGSYDTYLREFREQPGTYYLTKGWIEKARSPLKVYEEYRKKYDEETVNWLFREEFKNYTRIALIDNGSYDAGLYYQHALENAQFLKVKCETLKGSLRFFEKMVKGPWDGEFVTVLAGEEIRQEPFLRL